MNKWRSSCARAIWGRGVRFRCNETLFSLLCRGHAADPLQASVMRIIKSAKRMLARYPRRRQQLAAVIQLRTAGAGANKKHVIGPGRQLLWAMQTVGWTMDEDFHVSTRDGRHEFSLINVDDGFMEHILREDLRTQVCSEASREGLQSWRESNMVLTGTLR